MDADEIGQVLVEDVYRRLLVRWMSWNDRPPDPDGEQRMRAAAQYEVDRA